MYLNQIHTKINSIQDNIGKLKDLPQEDAQELGNLNPISLRVRLDAIQQRLGENTSEELRLIQTVVDLKNQLIGLPFLKIWIQTLINKKGSLNENWVKQAGRLLWKNREQIIWGDTPLVKESRDLMPELLEKIASSSAEEKTKEFCVDLIKRAREQYQTPWLSLEMCAEVLRYAEPDAVVKALQELRKENIEGAGSLLAELIVLKKIPYSLFEEFPDFEKYVLPHMTHFDLSDEPPSEVKKLLQKLSQRDEPVRSLCLPNAYNTPVPAKLLEQLEEFKMGSKFNQSLKEVNLSNLKKLEMGHDFDKPLPKDLSSLETLIMGYEFNQSLEEVNLSNLKKLEMGHDFDKPLPKDLSSLETLIMGDADGCQFNHSLEEIDLYNLKELRTGSNYNAPLPEGIDSLEILEMIGSRFNRPLPPGLNLSSLHTLLLGPWFNHPLHGYDLRRLEIFEMGADFKQTLRGLALPSLKNLRCGLWFDHPLPNLLNPKSLEILRLGEYYREPLPKSWDYSSLQSLILSGYYPEDYLKELNFSSSVEITKYRRSMH